MLSRKTLKKNGGFSEHLNILFMRKTGLLFQINFGIHEAQKTEDQQDIELDSIGSASHYKPAILPMYEVDSKNKNDNISNSYWLYVPVKPK